MGGGQDRYEILREQLTARGGVLADEADAMSVLEAASQDSTFWSAVYNNTEKTVDIAIHGEYDTVYSYSLADW